MILVSACLLGQNVKYNGGNNACELLQVYEGQGHFVPICPEGFAALPIPRPPMEIQQGTGEDLLAGRVRVLDRTGRDMTESLRLGAQKALALAQKYHAKTAILKESSPSCGVHRIYDGSFAGRKIPGSGAAAALLREHGLTLYSEKELTPALLAKLMAEDKDSMKNE